MEISLKTYKPLYKGDFGRLSNDLGAYRALVEEVVGADAITAEAPTKGPVVEREWRDAPVDVLLGSVKIKTGKLEQVLRRSNKHVGTFIF